MAVRSFASSGDVDDVFLLLGVKPTTLSRLLGAHALPLAQIQVCAKAVSRSIDMLLFEDFAGTQDIKSSFLTELDCTFWHVRMSEKHRMGGTETGRRARPVGGDMGEEVIGSVGPSEKEMSLLPVSDTQSGLQRSYTCLPENQR